MSDLTHRQVERRYLGEFAVVIAAYIAAVLGVESYIHAAHPHGALLTALAVLPALPIVGIFVVMGRFIAAADEFVRAGVVKALLIAGAVVFSGVTAWDFLRVYAGAPAIEPFIIGPCYFAAFGLARGLIVIGEKLSGARAA